MSNQFNQETNAAQVSASSTKVSINNLSTEQFDGVDVLGVETLDAVSGGAVVLGTGGVEVSLTPIRRRVLPIS